MSKFIASFLVLVLTAAVFAQNAVPGVTILPASTIMKGNPKEPDALQAARAAFADQQRSAEKAYNLALAQNERHLLGAVTSALKDPKVTDPDTVANLAAETKRLQASIDEHTKAAANPSGQPQVFTIDSKKEWQGTIKVTKGQMVAYEATGQWCDCVSRRATSIKDGSALEGRIGENGVVFQMGKSGAFMVHEDGELQLELWDSFRADNDGSVSVKILVK